MADVPPERVGKPDVPENGPPPLPRWVKVAVLVIAVLMLALLAATLLGGNHGPGRHFNSADDHFRQQTQAAATWSNTGAQIDQFSS